MAKKQIPVTQDIEAGVPIPVNREAWPIGELDVGEMFKFPYVKHRSLRSRVNLMNQKYEDREFVVRKIDDEFGGVWRVK